MSHRAGRRRSRTRSARAPRTGALLLSLCVAALLSGSAQAATPAGKPLGITEFDAALLGTTPLPVGVDAYRQALLALQPQYLRVVVDWHKLQPDPAQPAALDAPQDGCLRGLAPCTPHRGVLDELRAAKAHGWKALVVITGVPDWAAAAPAGCEEADASPRGRPISAAGLDAYERLVRQTYDLGASLGLDLDLWSPWNEPNHPDFVSPQRLTCATSSPSQSPAVYTRLARAAHHALAGTDARFVLGETAGFRRPSPHATGVGEFLRALPDDVACGAVAYDQHEYGSVNDEPAAPFARDAVAEAEGALDERPCTRGLPVWVSETGIGDASSGGVRSTDPASLALQCDRLAARFARWRADPRVGAIFAYTFREDTAFPVGMADAQLTRLYPTYQLWLTGACPDGAPMNPVPVTTTTTPAPTTAPAPAPAPTPTPDPMPTTSTPAPVPVATTTTTPAAPDPVPTTATTVSAPPPDPVQTTSTTAPPPAPVLTTATTTPAPVPVPTTPATAPEAPAPALPAIPMLPAPAPLAILPLPSPSTPAVALRLRPAIRASSPATVARTGLRVAPGCSERCRATVTLTVAASQAKRLGLLGRTSPARSTPIGRASRSALGPGDVVLVALSARARTALARASSVRIAAIVTGEAGGRRTTASVGRVLAR